MRTLMFGSELWDVVSLVVVFTCKLSCCFGFIPSEVTDSCICKIFILLFKWKVEELLRKSVLAFDVIIRQAMAFDIEETLWSLESSHIA
jgi:hypothetical protein